MRGTYIGPIEHLKGKTALLQHDPAHQFFVRVQFDDRSLRRDTAEPFDYDPPVVTTLPADALGFGWHAFQWQHFSVLEDEPDIEPHAMPMRSDRSHLRGHS